MSTSTFFTRSVIFIAIVGLAYLAYKIAVATVPIVAVVVLTLVGFNGLKSFFKGRFKLSEEEKGKDRVENIAKIMNQVSKQNKSSDGSYMELSEEAASNSAILYVTIYVLWQFVVGAALLVYALDPKFQFMPYSILGLVLAAFQVFKVYSGLKILFTSTVALKQPGTDESWKAWTFSKLYTILVVVYTTSIWMIVFGVISSPS